MSQKHFCNRSSTCYMLENVSGLLAEALSIKSKQTLKFKIDWQHLLVRKDGVIPNTNKIGVSYILCRRIVFGTTLPSMGKVPRKKQALNYFASTCDRTWGTRRTRSAPHPPIVAAWCSIPDPYVRTWCIPRPLLHALSICPISFCLLRLLGSPAVPSCTFATTPSDPTSSRSFSLRIPKVGIGIHTTGIWPRLWHCRTPAAFLSLDRTASWPTLLPPFPPSKTSASIPGGTCTSFYSFQILLLPENAPFVARAARSAPPPTFVRVVRQHPIRTHRQSMLPHKISMNRIDTFRWWRCHPDPVRLKRAFDWKA